MKPRIDDPVLYQWEVNSNHTRFDYIRASPSNNVLHQQFAILAATNAMTATFLAVFLIALLRSPKVRTNCFHLYILAVSFPDFLAAFFCFLTCLLSATKSRYWSESMCGFQAWYMAFGFTGNAWMNAVITYQVHKILRFSKIRRRYIPPSMANVRNHIAVVYVYATLLGFWNAFEIPGVPLEPQLNYGFSCMSMEYDRPSAFVFWLVLWPAVLGIPMLYANYVVYDVWKRDLLPPKGRRREIAIFLLRLVFIYYVAWTPFLILSTLGNFVLINSWVIWAGGFVAHFQGICSALYCLNNASIRSAMLHFVSCGKYPSSLTESSRGRRENGNIVASPNVTRPSHDQSGVTQQEEDDFLDFDGKVEESSDEESGAVVVVVSEENNTEKESKHSKEATPPPE